MSSASTDSQDQGQETGETVAQATMHETENLRGALGAAASELVEEAEDAAKSAVEQLKERPAGQLDRLASALQRSAVELGPEEDWLAQMARAAADQLKRSSEHLHHQDFRALASETSDFARKHPAVFVGAAVALGFGAARLASAHKPRSQSGDSYSPTARSNAND